MLCSIKELIELSCCIFVMTDDKKKLNYSLINDLSIIIIFENRKILTFNFYHFKNQL